MAVKEYEPGKWLFFGSIYKDGKRVRRYKKRGFPSAAKARKAERRYRVKLEEEVEIEVTKGIPFSTLKDLYLENWRKTVKESSYKAEVEIWDKIERETKEMDLMSSEDLQKYINQCDQNTSVSVSLAFRYDRCSR